MKPERVQIVVGTTTLSHVPAEEGLPRAAHHQGRVSVLELVPGNALEPATLAVAADMRFFEPVHAVAMARQAHCIYPRNLCWHT